MGPQRSHLIGFHPELNEPEEVGSVRQFKGVGVRVTYSHESLEPALDASLVVHGGRNQLGGGVQHQLPTSDTDEVLGGVR